MARRESEYLFDRRLADRGNDTSVFYSRAREDRFNRDRRFAARGNEIGNRDPWDFEIKRLKRRVRDLELQQEIKRLRQRIRYLRLRQDTCRTETESSTVVRDEGGDGEQQPFSRHPHRFSEPIYPAVQYQEDESAQECLLKDEPRFDENTAEPDQEEYLWVQRAINGVINRDDEEEAVEDYNSSVASGMFVEDWKMVKPLHDGCTSNESMGLNGKALAKEMTDCAMLIADVMNWKYDDESALKFGNVESVDGSSPTVATVGPVAPKVTPSFMPKGRYYMDLCCQACRILEGEFFRRGCHIASIGDEVAGIENGVCMESVEPANPLVVQGGSVTPVTLDETATIKEFSQDWVKISFPLPKDMLRLKNASIISKFEIGKNIQIRDKIVAIIKGDTVDNGEKPHAHVDLTRVIHKSKEEKNGLQGINFEEYIEMVESTLSIPPMHDNLPCGPVKFSEIYLANKVVKDDDDVVVVAGMSLNSFLKVKNLDNIKVAKYVEEKDSIPFGEPRFTYQEQVFPFDPGGFG